MVLQQFVFESFNKQHLFTFSFHSVRCRYYRYSTDNASFIFGKFISLHAVHDTSNSEKWLG